MALAEGGVLSSISVINTFGFGIVIYRISLFDKVKARNYPPLASPSSP